MTSKRRGPGRRASGRPFTRRDVGDRRRVCVIGSGPLFLSGISYYTHRLATALGQRDDVSVILMRRLVPVRLYPGREHVGQQLAGFRYAPTIPAFDGVDWYWLRSMGGALRFLRTQRPAVVVLQWWTGAVLHSFLLLALAARRMGAHVVIEFHEVQDTGELRFPLARTYVDLVAPLLFKMMHGAVVHSEWDRAAVEKRYHFGDQPVAVIPHGPYDGIAGSHRSPRLSREPCRLLYFGVIRPFKGVEDLVRAFDSIPAAEIDGYLLTIVGETWEGWTGPADLIASSPYRERITFVNRYVTDEELGVHIAEADVVVLPYHRSSSSGPLHVAMSHGKPVIVTNVGGLVEAAQEYGGTTFVPPQNPDAIRVALGDVAAQPGAAFADPHSWDRSVQRYHALFDAMERQDPSTAGVEHGTSALSAGR